MYTKDLLGEAEDALSHLSFEVFGSQSLRLAFWFASRLGDRRMDQKSKQQITWISEFG